jgi:hypothetical protein
MLLSGTCGMLVAVGIRLTGVTDLTPETDPAIELGFG